MASPTFDERIAAHFQRMSPAERRVARFFQENREQVLIASAAALASKAETSDATILRATKALDFGLDDLRRALADELRNSLSPAERLTRTLGEVGFSLSAAFKMTLEINRQSLEAFAAPSHPTTSRRRQAASSGLNASWSSARTVERNGDLFRHPTHAFRPRYYKLDEYGNISASVRAQACS